MFLYRIRTHSLMYEAILLPRSAELKILARRASNFNVRIFQHALATATLTPRRLPRLAKLNARSKIIAAWPWIPIDELADIRWQKRQDVAKHMFWNVRLMPLPKHLLYTKRTPINSNCRYNINDLPRPTWMFPGQSRPNCSPNSSCKLGCENSAERATQLDCPNNTPFQRAFCAIQVVAAR